MQNDLYFYIMVLGVILVGFAVVLPKRKSKEEGHGISNLPNDNQGMNTTQLLSEMKQDMERKMGELSRQIQDLKAELEHVQVHSSATGVVTGEKGQKLKLDQRYAEIFDLFNKGESEEEIARTLDMGTGEVGMIIQLQKITATPRKQKGHGGSNHE